MPGDLLKPAPASSAGSILALGLGHATNDLYVSFLPPLLPIFIANLGLSHTQAGLLSFLRMVPSLLQPAIGSLADRVSLRKLVILAPLVTAITTGLLGLARNYGLLAWLLILGGLSTAAFHAITPAMTANLSSRGNMGRGLAVWMFGGEIGFMLGPLLVVTVVERYGLRSSPWLIIFGMVGALLLAMNLRESPVPRPQLAQGRHWQEALRQVWPAMGPVLALTTARSLALSALGSYLPTLLSETGSSFWLAGLSLTIYQAAASIGVLFGGSLSDRLGRHVVLLASMLLTPAFLFAFLTLAGSPQILTLLGIGLVVVTFDPVAMAIIQESSTQNRGLASSLYLSLSFFIRALATLVVGAMGDWLGLPMAFAISTVVFLLGTPLVFLLPNRPRAEAAT
jgi:FSR family fosmidomycin resistance protein-like MFS transporter